MSTDNNKFFFVAPIRTLSDREYANNQRLQLRSWMFSLKRRFPKRMSPFVQSELQWLSAHHEHLSALVEAFDRKQSIAARCTPDDSLTHLIASLPQSLTQSRLNKGWSVSELAERSGISERTLRTYEATNFRGATLDKLARLAKSLSS